MFAVVITEKGGAQRRLEFDKNEVTIGRVQGNDIILPKGNVSKRHSRIVLKDNRFIVVDLKSTNGTYVNGRKITSPLVVKAGDKIYIGDFILTLEEAAGAGAGAPEPQPPPMQHQPPPMQQHQPPPQQHQAPPMQQHQPPPMQQPPPAQHQPPPMQQPPPAQDRRPPPLRSAPPPAGRSAPMERAPAPPPLPARKPAPRVPSEPPPRDPPPAERYPIDEEPADETVAPSPRVLAGRPASRPEPDADQAPMRTDAPPPNRARAPRAARAAEPSAPHASSNGAPAPQSARASRPRTTEDPLAFVLAVMAETVDVDSSTPPSALSASHWADARSAAEAAVEQLESEGGSAGDRDALINQAVSEGLGYGALTALLDDSGVLEVVIEGPGTILVDRGHGLSGAPGRFSSVEQLCAIVGRLVASGGRAFDPGASIHDATLPDGSHLLAMLPPVAVRGPVVEIRRTGRAPTTGESLVQQGVLSASMLSTLQAAVRARKNVVVLGISEAVPPVVAAIANMAHSDERVLSVERTPELALGASSAVRLASSSAVGLGALIAQVSRLRADRVVIDGVSGAELRDALVALAGRGEACVLGVRSNPPAGPVDHLEALASLAGTSEGLGRLVAAAAHVVVVVGRDPAGARRVTQVAEVSLDEGLAIVNGIHEFAEEFSDTGHAPSFA